MIWRRRASSASFVAWFYPPGFIIFPLPRSCIRVRLPLREHILYHPTHHQLGFPHLLRRSTEGPNKLVHQNRKQNFIMGCASSVVAESPSAKPSATAKEAVEKTGKPQNDLKPSQYVRHHGDFIFDGSLSEDEVMTMDVIPSLLANKSSAHACM